jgi:hypothetical protein
MKSSVHNHRYLSSGLEQGAGGRRGGLAGHPLGSSPVLTFCQGLDGFGLARPGTRIPGADAPAQRAFDQPQFVPGGDGEVNNAPTSTSRTPTVHKLAPAAASVDERDVRVDDGGGEGDPFAVNTRVGEVIADEWGSEGPAQLRIGVHLNRTWHELDIIGYPPTTPDGITRAGERGLLSVVIGSCGGSEPG